MLYTDDAIEALVLIICIIGVVWLVCWAVGGAYALHLMSGLDPEVLWGMQLVRAGQ